MLLGASVVVWALQYFDFSFHHVQDSSQSILGVIGTAIAPVFQPLGFGDWRSSVSLFKRPDRARAGGKLPRHPLRGERSRVDGCFAGGLFPGGRICVYDLCASVHPLHRRCDDNPPRDEFRQVDSVCLGFSSGGRLSGHVCGVSAWPAVDAGILKR